ncbi:MAG: RIP metalloprotease RseP [Acidobacteria bacterium]|nr:RIP metalloprotease RseP [Acidobacteriota bacterium]
MTTLIAMAVLLGIVILVHEWGHYAAARLCGIRVDTFSIGFGPRVWGWKRGKTDYRLSILPLGGYVKMAGDNPMEEREGAPDEFLSKSRWQRAIVAVAGPVMNVILAFVAVWVLLWHWGIPYPAFYDNAPQIVAFPKDAAGAAAGLQVDDSILEVNGTPVASWRQTYTALDKVEVGDVIRLRVARAGNPVDVKFQKTSRTDVYGVVGYEPIEPILDQVAPGRPAAIAGLKPGDRIVAVNREGIVAWSQFTRVVRASVGEPIEVRVRRGEDELAFQVVPAQAVDETGRNTRQIGIQVKQATAYEPVTMVRAVRGAGTAILGLTEQIVGVVGGLLQGKVSIKSMGGVIEIGRQAGNAAREGMQPFVYLIAFISMNLAILNLLPIPILDGGHLLMLAIEGTIRRDLSMAVKERFLQVGMVFLLALFAIVMYNDVLRVLLKR